MKHNETILCGKYGQMNNKFYLCGKINLMGTRLLFILLVVVFVSCNRYQEDIDKMAQIKKVGDTQPELAMRMLDSLNVAIRKMPEDLQMKYDLLDVRLHDKAYIVATSDLKIKPVVDYYNKNGNSREKQEAFYYAGSVYRDLHDTPKAMEYFLRSVDECQPGVDFDSLTLRNAYSQLGDLYYKVQNYDESLRMADKEETIAKAIGVLNASTLVSVGASLKRVGKNALAKKKFLEALHLMLSNESTIYAQDLYSLLYHFSVLQMPQQADETYNIILQQKKENVNFPNDDSMMGEFFMLKHKKDPAIFCFQKVL